MGAGSEPELLSNGVLDYLLTPSNSNMKKEEYKNYKERAEYLSFITPSRKEIYLAIAEFFGEEEIPPKLKKMKF